MKQVLGMKSVDSVLSVVVHDLVRDEERTMSVGSTERRERKIGEKRQTRSGQWLEIQQSMFEFWKLTEF